MDISGVFQAVLPGVGHITQNTRNRTAQLLTPFHAFGAFGAVYAHKFPQNVNRSRKRHIPIVDQLYDDVPTLIKEHLSVP